MSEKVDTTASRSIGAEIYLAKLFSVVLVAMSQETQIDEAAKSNDIPIGACSMPAMPEDIING